MGCCPRPAWADLTMFFLLHNFTSVFLSPFSVFLGLRWCFVAFLGSKALFLSDEKTGHPLFPVFPWPLFEERLLLRSFFFCQCWLTAFVTLASHARSFICSIRSAVAKNLVQYGGGLPSGLTRRAAMRTGTSCGWQFSTHAACSTVSRAGSCPKRLRN
jgi:hypothetical protein